MADLFEQFDRFDQRLERIGRAQRNRKQGYTAVISHDGLITLKAKPRKRRTLPIKGIVLMVFGVIGFKALMLTHLGPQAYNGRVEKLQTGTMVEQAGAIVMGADPVTRWIAQQIRPMFR